MRGSSKTPPKYWKHKRSGKAVVTLNDRDHYLGLYGTKASKLEYDRLIAEWLSNGRKLAEPQPIYSVNMLVDDATVDATIEFCSLIVADMIRVQPLTGARPGEIRTMTPGEIERTRDVWRYTPGSHNNAAQTTIVGDSHWSHGSSRAYALHVR